MSDTVHSAATAGRDIDDLEEIVRSFPSILGTLRESYAELEEHAVRVENELYLANQELERKVHELDVVKRHLEAVLESLPCGVVVRDAAGEITRVNGMALDILGVASEEMIGRPGHEALRGAESDGAPYEVRRRDGRRLVLVSHASHIQLADGSIDGSVEILDDRTERTALAEKLHAADKMAALGTMAAGIAHEIRNPLSAVKGFAALLRGGDRPEEQARRWISLIEEGVDEIDSIIQNLLTLGSPERLRLEAVDGAALLSDAVRLAVGESPITPTGHPIAVHTHSDAPPFVGDQIKLRQAIRNLVANAANEQRDGGRIDIDLCRKGEEVVVRVADAGPGIPSDLRNRILDPFFTTHADGTGLGLALVSTIARLHGGEIEVNPEPSALGGAEVSFRFPYQPVDSPAPPQDSPGR